MLRSKNRLLNILVSERMIVPVITMLCGVFVIHDGRGPWGLTVPSPGRYYAGAILVLISLFAFWFVLSNRDTQPTRSIGISLPSMNKDLVHKFYSYIKSILLGLAYFIFWYLILYAVNYLKFGGKTFSGGNILLLLYYGWFIHLTFGYLNNSNMYLIYGEVLKPYSDEDTTNNRSKKRSRRFWFTFGGLSMLLSISAPFWM